MSTYTLTGRRVLITRAADDAARWAARLTVHGAVVDVMPCVRTQRITDAGTRERLLAALHDADCLVLTSARGVDAVAGLPGVTALASAARETVAVGAATAGAMADRLGVIPYVARGGSARALGDELAARWGARSAGRRVVVVGARDGRTDVENALRAAGACVTRVDVYRTIPAPPRQHRRNLAGDGITDVLLASPSAVTGLLNQAVVTNGVRLYAIGATTAAAIAAAALRLTAQSATPDLDGLLEAMRCAPRV